MKIIIGAIALAFAVPAAAQNAPAGQHQGHDQHQGNGQHQGHGQQQPGQHQEHEGGCCADRNGDGRMDCCEGQGGEGCSHEAGDHAGH
ncbi:MAG TPA: hypothetical protein VGX37_05895 [Allosphingosinicella sp.]|jgi:hypothetical protein|nr:hypothetical protein [Allosphingosinicella sp.]